MSSFYGIGVMSGSSLDGIDLCFAEFTGDKESDIWGYRIDNTITVEYTREMMNRLANATKCTALELVQLNHDISHFLGKSLRQFIDAKLLHPDFISFNGHVVFHQPENGLSFSLGDGEIMASYLGCPLVTNFQSKNIALNGQGGPLIPNGERFLFQQTDICLNLGGIANLGSHGEEGFDICPCNVILNHLATLHDPDLNYDKDGQIAAQGTVVPSVLERLNGLEFYQQAGPKSINSDWVEENIKPLLKSDSHSIPDLTRTFVQHIAERVTDTCTKMKRRDHCTILLTGGGSFNQTLINVLKEHLLKQKIQIVDTENEIVEYKEALVIAFMGLRSLLGVENVFSSVTGSKSDCVSGAVHHGVTEHRRPNLQDQFNFMIRKASLNYHH